MADEKVQIVIRTTETERAQIKQLAEDHKKSMNQYILDSILYNNDTESDSANDTIDNSFLIQQLAEKDKQIASMQKLLDQQQQLSLADKREKDQLKLELADTKPNKVWWRKWLK